MEINKQQAKDYICNTFNNQEKKSGKKINSDSQKKKKESTMNA